MSEKKIGEMRNTGTIDRAAILAECRNYLREQGDSSTDDNIE